MKLLCMHSRQKAPKERHSDQTCHAILLHKPVEICHYCYLERVQCLQLHVVHNFIVTMKIDSAQITNVCKAGLTMYESHFGLRKVSSVQIRWINF